MKKRLTRLMMATSLFTFLVMALLLFCLTGAVHPDLLVSLLWLLIISVIVVVPTARLLSSLLSEREVKNIVTPLNAMDLEHPELSQVDGELRPLTRKIQEQTAVLTDQMNQIREESVNREIQRREFTANVSHELKTPLTIISGTAEILRSGIVKPEDVAHFADNIYKESQRMITLVSDIIHLSRLEEPSPADRKERIDLYRAAQDVIGWLQSSAQKKGVTFSLTGTSAMVLGVEKILCDIVYNLCDNAIKYNHPGGWVKVTVRDSGGRVRLTVADTGIGIPKEHQERVFERFYRVDTSHSREIGGTGLGLSIVKHGAIFHGADLTLRSQPGSGTIVTLLFPKPSAPPQEPS